MAIQGPKIDKRGNQQIVVTNGTTGEVFFEADPGKHFRLGVNSGHGATYDVVVQLTNADGGIDTPVTMTESTGNTDGVSLSGRPGVVKVGINLTVTPTTDLTMEFSQAKG